MGKMRGAELLCARRVNYSDTRKRAFARAYKNTRYGSVIYRSSRSDPARYTASSCSVVQHAFSLLLGGDNIRSVAFFYADGECVQATFDSTIFALVSEHGHLTPEERKIEGGGQHGKVRRVERGCISSLSHQK